LREVCNKIDHIQTGHYFNKHISSNPFIQILVRRYRQTLQRLIVNLPICSVLEVGSGEGFILSYIREVKDKVYLVGSDITWDVLQEAHKQEPTALLCVARGEHLPFADCSFDALIACEVLEHIPEPRLVVRELQRVSRKFCIISVPDEPLWRVLNMLRGRYWHDWGNTPGHIQHWSVKGISYLMSEYFEAVRTIRSFPWIFVFASKEIPPTGDCILPYKQVL